MSLSQGETAPALTLPCSGGGTVTLGESKRYTVLYFYPKDDTPGCTVEANEFTVLKDEFAGEGADIYGVSKDNVESHDKFVAKHCIGFPLLSDDEGAACEAFGVWVEKNMFGKKYMGIERATFLLSPDNKAVEVWRKVTPKGHAAAVLKALKEEKSRSAA